MIAKQLGAAVILAHRLQLAPAALVVGEIGNAPRRPVHLPGLRDDLAVVRHPGSRQDAGRDRSEAIGRDPSCAAEPRSVERFKHDGSIPTGTTPEEFAAFFQKEAKLWGDIVKLEP